MHVAAGVGGVTVTRTGNGVVHLSGVQRCASVSSCPVCAPVIRERRAKEIDSACGVALDRGLFVYFVTATVSHKLGEDLGDVLGLVTGAWSDTFKGRQSMEWRQASGYVGQIRVIESTHGVNGWHPHVHALLIFDREAAGSVRALGVTFSQFVHARGGRADVLSLASPGWNVSRVESAGDVSKYLAKIEGGWGAGLEMARGDLKSARRGGATPFEILNAAVEGDVGAAVLWFVYERAMKGRRVFQWSRGLHALLGVEVVEDAEAAIAETVELKTGEWFIPADEWTEIVRSGALGSVLAMYGRPDRTPAEPLLPTSTG